MMIQCAQASRERGINPVFIYGFFGGMVHMLHDVGYIMGIFAGGLNELGLQPLTSIALFSVYLLALVYFVGQGGFKQALSPNRARAERIELIPTAAAPAKRKRPSASAEDERETRGYQDRVSKQCALVKKHYKLSDRGAEVMELIARGNTVARIAETLLVSETPSERTASASTRSSIYTASKSWRTWLIPSIREPSKTNRTAGRGPARPHSDFARKATGRRACLPATRSLSNDCRKCAWSSSPNEEALPWARPSPRACSRSSP